ncbi:MAG: sodium ion-translocating decarboxylase subunit beta [Candidatus Geothermarchaeales archaeon]
MMLPFPLGNAIMIGVGGLLCYLAIKKGYEPLLLLPIGFGAIIVNIPYGGLMEPGGFLRFLYDFGITSELFPILIFIGIGAMCDFGPLLERPWLMIFSAAGQIGIFIALICALLLGFPPREASCIGIIGAMDGPTAIYITSKYAPHILGSVTVAAYSYMSMVPIFQIPISKALTTRRERLIRMKYEPGAYPRVVRLLFPIMVTLVTSIIAPKGVPLMGSLMLGNFMKESGVVERLSRTSENELANITTLLLGITIGGTMMAEQFLNVQTLLIFALGVIAFVSAIACGVLFAKAVCFITKGKVNPLIGGAGTSAFPMAARTAHRIGREEDPDNWLLMHAMMTNTGGQIGSVIAGGVILTFAPLLPGFL